MKMKKIPLLVIFMLIGFSLFAQTADKPAADPLPADLMALQTANSLARYGYSAQSASALIGAAEILARIRTQPLGVTPERTNASAATAETPEFTPANLLADGKKLAGKDKTLLAWAADVEKSLNTRTRGAVGGPKSARDVIAGGDTHTFRINLRGGERTDIALIGNAASDLDIYVFDGYGNLIVGDEGYTDVSSLWVIPAATGPFSIVIKNCGPRANRYELYTN
jgi:hypothetical protein